jgi:hypothetical protein
VAPAWVLALALQASGAPPEQATVPAIEPILLQIVVEQGIIIRVPPQRQAATFTASSQTSSRRTPPPQPIKWKERDAPKCLAMRDVVAVQVTRKDSIDLLTRERQRLRAQLDGRCRAQDFYSGFYMQRSRDGRLCEDRDILQTRSGLKCEVDKFRLMVPVATKQK